MNDLAHFNSPIGCIEVEGSENGISAVRILPEQVAESEQIPDSLKECVSQLKEYFDGKRTQFRLTLDISNAPPFYREVWKIVRIIPFGKTRSYSDIAQILDQPGAVRAVGQANGKNPIPIIIPCHRVVGKNGNLTGYVYGIPIKEKLLRLENPKKFALQGLLF